MEVIDSIALWKVNGKSEKFLDVIFTDLFTDGENAENNQIVCLVQSTSSRVRVMGKVVF